MKKRMKGFTLIELIAVLVIMAILALIVTPLVMNVIRKARVSADRRSVDAYGRSIELAIAGYLLDNGKFPTEVSQLTIEYSGNKVECETTQIKSDSSVYLAGCTVAGRSTGDYTYGSEEVAPTYKVGDEVRYNNVDYYVIKDSGAKESTVTLLKATPLTTEEVNTYGGVGTANNHVNMYNCDESNTSCYRTAHDHNGVGGMAYYSSPTCGYNTETGGLTDTGCTTDYAQSEVKYVLDAWAAAKARPNDLKADSTGYSVRLLTIDDFIDNLGYNWQQTSAGNPTINDDVPEFMIPENNSYWYWSMSQKNEEASVVWGVNYAGSLSAYHVCGNIDYGIRAVRPVITISKSAL